MSRTRTHETVERMERECVGNQLRLLSRVVTGIYENELRPLKLTASQMIILAFTAKRGRVRPVQLCQALQMDASTVSRNLERMRTRSWLEQVPGESSRSRPFRVTAGGRKMLADATVAWERAQTKAVALLGEEGVSLLRHTVKSVTGQSRSD